MGSLIIVMFLMALVHQAGFINAGGYGINGMWGLPLGIIAGIIGGFVALSLDSC